MNSGYAPPPCPPPQPARLFLEAVTVCVGYADILAHTLPDNRILFDYLVVVTSPADTDTQKVCEYWNVHCITDPMLVPAPLKFCKGVGINSGLAVLKKTGWVCHLDADIACPPKMRQLLEQAKLNPRKIYGCDRMDVPSYEDWQRFRALPRVQWEDDVYLHHGPFQTSTRVVHPAFSGYIPIGFFQLWNPEGSGVYQYLSGHTDAGREDALFAAQWPRSERELLPELIVYHLESGPAQVGANWRGRMTPRFGPEPLRRVPGKAPSKEPAHSF
jgi:hypothetical protein